MGHSTGIPYASLNYNEDSLVKAGVVVSSMGHTGSVMLVSNLG